MNVWNGMGRLTKDAELKYSASNMAIAKFTIAVERGYQKQGEEKKVDFINCTAFGAMAEKYIGLYFKKGMRVAVTGELRIEKYTKDDKTMYFTEIGVNRAYFADGKRDSQGDAHEPVANNQQSDAFYPVSDDDDELPF